jgi:hypothetical protein
MQWNQIRRASASSRWKLPAASSKRMKWPRDPMGDACRPGQFNFNQHSIIVALVLLSTAKARAREIDNWVRLGWGIDCGRQFWAGLVQVMPVHNLSSSSPRTLASQSPLVD